MPSNYILKSCSTLELFISRQIPVLLIIIFSGSYTIVHGQRPDLVVTQGQFSTGFVSRGDDFSMQIRVTNIGSASAGQSYLYFYLSKDENLPDSKILGRVSVNALARNQSANIDINYPIPNSLTPGSYFIFIKLDITNQVIESDEQNTFYLPMQVIVSSGNKPRVRLPYPIVFIHGLVGNDDTWNELKTELTQVQRLTFGGRLDFCLNTDNNPFNATIGTDFKDFTNPDLLNPADFYTLNFAVHPNGVKYTNTRDPNQSNQAAIAKQGLAVKEAVKHILAITKRDKVILVGHSMGGLAAREYLQNPTNYQEDGEHHVAKLLTIGTPHGGSNFTASGLGSILGFDELSEAVRDLRNSYYSGFPGAYLFGGLESHSQIRGEISNFKNVDVNCNGTIGENIQGINQKAIPSDLAFACIVGTGSALGGDGVVTEYSANFNNFKEVFADTFRIVQSPLDLSLHHLNLHKDPQVVMKGLDEANEGEVAYEIALNQTYFAFSNAQPVFGYNADYDVFKFKMHQSSDVILKVSNIPIPEFTINVYNENGVLLSSLASNGQGSLAFSMQLTPGIYYIEFESKWTGLSYKFPYSFILEGDEQVHVKEIVANERNLLISPNPVINEANLIIGFDKEQDVSISILDLNGRIISQKLMRAKAGRNIIDLSLDNLLNGVYLCSVTSENEIKSVKFVVAR